MNVLKNRPAGVKSGWSRHGATAGGKRRAAWLCTCLSTVAHTTVHLALTPHHCSLKTTLHLYNKRVSKYPMLIYISWQVPPLVKLAEPARQKHKLQPVTLFSYMHGVVVSFMHWILGQKLSNTSHNKALRSRVIIDHRFIINYRYPTVINIELLKVDLQSRTSSLDWV